MRLEALYRATFTTPEVWSMELVGPAVTEAVCTVDRAQPSPARDVVTRYSREVLQTSSPAARTDPDW
jgi:hypothetical protein